MSNSSSHPIIIHTHAEPTQQPQQDQGSQQVPARVRTAVHLVEHFTAKTSIQAMPIKSGFDDGNEWIPLPQVKLTQEEIDAQNAALRLLENYFDGTMREASLEVLERNRQEEREKQARLSGGPVIVIDCPQCGGGQNQYRCLLCRTKGRVTIGLAP